MTTSAGAKLFSKGAEAIIIILTKDVRGFDGEGGNLKLFLTYIKQRANVFNWTAILTISVDGIGKTMVECPLRVEALNSILAEVDVYTVNGIPTVVDLCSSRNDLAARGEVTNNLLFNLFEGYDAVIDLDFKDYIKQKKSSYKDGTLNLEEDQLMLIAENKFDLLVQSGSWSQPTREQEQNIALMATIQSMEKIFKSTLKPSTKKKDDKKKPTQTKTRSKEDSGFAWKLTRTPGEVSRNVSGKIYYWCTKHNAFTLHKPEECHLEVDSATSTMYSISISQALVGAIPTRDINRDSSSRIVAASWSQ
eukprot:scaffold325090_cov78-Attheya_sp.AAC.1